MTGVPASPRTTTGSCSPIRMNANPLSRNVTICQTDVPSSRVSDEKIRDARLPMNEPRDDSGQDARPIEPVGRQEGRVGDDE